MNLLESRLEKASSNAGDDTLDAPDHESATATAEDEAYDPGVPPVYTLQTQAPASGATAPGSTPAAMASDECADADDIRSVIPAGWRFCGTFHSSGGSLLLAGQLDGGVTLRGDGQLAVATGGLLTGEAHAGDVLVSGKVKGKINAPGGTVELSEHSSVDGSVVYGRIRVGGGRHSMQIECVESAANT